jgi:hypothetical protein
LTARRELLLFPDQRTSPTLGSRETVSASLKKLLADLAEVWEASGKAVLEMLATDGPGKLPQIDYGLLPRDIFISVEQRTPGNLDPDEWAILRRVIDLLQQNAKGAELGPVLETIESALRADQAKLVEAK